MTSNDEDDGGMHRPGSVMSATPSGKTVHDEAIELLRWALWLIGCMGVFYCRDRVWHCRGCNAEHTQPVNQLNADTFIRTFPHEPDCKYVRACKLTGVNRP